MHEQIPAATERAPRSERPVEAVSAYLRDLAAQENAEAGLELFDDKGRVRMDAFQAEAGGPYRTQDIAEHERFIRDKELEWSDFEDPRVRQFHIKEFGIVTEGKEEEAITRELLAAWRERQTGKDGPLAEAAITVVLARQLRGEYLVVRASTFDDYANGVDQLIVRRETGEVICAFDEVTDEAHGARMEKKRDKVRDRARRGGTTVAYGITAHNGELVRQPLAHIPTFALAIDRQSLHKLVAELREQGAEPGVNERATFAHLMDTLAEQVLDLERIAVPAAIRKNLERFKRSLTEMRAHGSAVAGKPAPNRPGSEPVRTGPAVR